jgi:hypothetical protein
VARIRTIKPEFFTSEDIVGLTPFARLLYIALWCEADKEGRLVWKPATFKLRYLPGDDIAVTTLCQELIDAGLVTLYGSGYAYIPTFKAHQHINPRESVSQLPDPDASTTRAARVGTRQARDSDAQGGREGKGKEGNETPNPQGGEFPGFAEFWNVWPVGDRKQAKGKCLEAWKKAGAEPHAALIVSHVERMKASPAWTKDAGQFVPAPMVYLNQRRWEGAEGASDWWTHAGFPDRYEAENAGCREHNAGQFRNGKRTTEPA